MRRLAISTITTTLCLGLAVTLAGCDDDVTKGDMTSSPDLSVNKVDGCCTQPIIDGGALDVGDFAMPIDANLDFTAPPDLFMPSDFTGRPVDFTGDFAPKPPDMTITVDAGPPPTVISHATWSSFCQVFAACGLLGANVSACVNYPPPLGSLPLEPASVLTCISAAGSDCAGVNQCFANGSTSTACNGDTFVPTCAGNVYQACLGPGTSSKYDVDCAKLGMTCVVPTKSSPLQFFCGFGACDPNVVLDYCVSNFDTKCVNGDLSPIEDCRVFDNEVCGLLPGGQSACMGTGPACTMDTCSGTTLVSCKHGKQATYDCSKIGLTCVAPIVNGVATPTCAKGIVCDASFKELCVGNVLTYCDAGIVATFDCAANGWKKCVPQASDGSGGFCSP